MSDLERIKQAKDARELELSGDRTEKLPEGYVTGGELYFLNEVAYIGPVLANVIGKKVAISAPTRVEDCEWTVPKSNRQLYNVYLDWKTGALRIDIQIPTPTGERAYGLYHPTAGWRWVNSFYVNQVGRIIQARFQSEVVIGYSGDGTPYAAQEGDTRIIIDDNEILFQVYRDGKWFTTTTVKGGLNDSASIQRPERFGTTGGVGMYPTFINDDEFVYVNYSDENKLYRKTKDRVSPGTEIGSASALFPYSNQNGDLVYINQDDGSTLYLKDLDVVGNGVQITTVVSWCPFLSRGAVTNKIFYINLDDGNTVYETNTGGGNGTQLFNEAVIWIAPLGTDSLLYMKTGEPGIYKKSILDGDPGEKIYNSVVEMVTAFDVETILFIKAEDDRIYKKTIGSDPSDDGEALFEIANVVTANNGDLAFGSNESSGDIDLALEDRRIPEAYLEAPANTALIIEGTITTGSVVMTDMEPETISFLAKGDFVVGTGLPEDTTITFLGNNYIELSAAATTTRTGSFETFGTRLYLDANKVIVKGSITAPLLEASAISSKALDDNGDPISDINLDTGKQIYRSQDGTIKLILDPATGTFKFGGDLEAVGGTFTGTLQAADGTFVGDLTVVSDVADRKIEVGSKGLLASDTNGEVVHDISRDEQTSDFDYAGHYHVINTLSFFKDLYSSVGNETDLFVPLPSIGIDYSFYKYAEVKVRGELIKQVGAGTFDGRSLLQLYMTDTDVSQDFFSQTQTLPVTTGRFQTTSNLKGRIFEDSGQYGIKLDASFTVSANVLAELYLYLIGVYT